MRLRGDPRLTARPAAETQELDGLDISEHGESMLEAGEMSEHGKHALYPSAAAPAAADSTVGAAGKVAPLEVISNCDK